MYVWKQQQLSIFIQKANCSHLMFFCCYCTLNGKQLVWIYSGTSFYLLHCIYILLKHSFVLKVKRLSDLMSLYQSRQESDSKMSWRLQLDGGLAADFESNLSGLGTELGTAAYNMRYSTLYTLLDVNFL